MKVRFALPILLTSASIMLSGLAISFAGAQDVPPTLPRPPQVRVPGVPTPPGEAAGADADTKVQPFRTGLEGTDARPTPPGARVAFNLEDADLPDLVRIVSRITGKRFILPSKARSIKATIYSPSDVTAAEAYQAFLSILELNGMTLETSGRYYKIVESSTIESRVLPLYEDGEAMPADDRFITRMHRLENVSAEDIAQLLTHFKTAEGAVTAYAPTNTLILTDTAASVRRMLRIIGEVDVPRTGEQIWVEPVHYASAEDMAELLTQVFPPEEGGAGAGGSKAAPARPRPGKAPATREADSAQPTGEAAASGTVGASAGGEARVRSIIGDERTNSLVIIATERAYLQIIEFLQVIDVSVEGEGSVHVHALQYADAELVAEVLSGVASDSGGGGAAAGGGGGAAATKARPAGEGGGGVISSEAHITAYKPTNSLIITASLQDYASLRRVISRLDVPPRQVFIEAVIMELQVERSSRLGLSFHGGAPEPQVDGNQGLTVFGFAPQQSLGFPASAIASQDALSGLAVGVRGPSLQIPGIGLSIPSFGAVLTAMATSSDVDVLSTPHLIAMDNAEAEINVGANVPLQTSGFGGIGGAGGLGGLAGLAGLAGQTGAAGQTGLGALGALGGLAGGLGGMGMMGGMGGMGGVQRQTVGTTIRLTPHINDTGDIRMEIEEEISEAGSPQGTLGVVPIEQRVAKTQVFVRDQQTIVIGGLMRDRVQTRETKVPILGDIPILGELFRTTSRETQKRNLLLFLTPYIVRSPEDLRSIFERRMRERQEFLDRYFVFGSHEYRPPLDYSRTRGLVHEIMGELREVDEERALMEQIRAQPPPEHHARPPIGEAEPYDGSIIIGPDGEEPISDEAPSGGGHIEAPVAPQE
ncbi:MAG: type II secretion system secretin GspD [Sandaracinaceae bacterium]|nr:type II secretion system secretin GspD [Sandaracinaceae bacterium]